MAERNEMMKRRHTHTHTHTHIHTHAIIEELSCLRSSKCFFLSAGTGYGTTNEDLGGRSNRQVVRVKSRREDDSPSPEDTTPVHARP